MIKFLDKYLAKKIEECKNNGMIPIGRFHEISNNQMFSLMDDMKDFALSLEGGKNE